MMINKGFTLIELVIVIVLLGILSAAALPRFVDFSNDAHEKKAKTVFEAYRAGLKLFHMQWQIQGKPSAGKTIYNGLQTNEYGYPAGIDNGTSVGDSGSQSQADYDDCIAILDKLVEISLSTVKYSYPNLASAGNADLGVRGSHSSNADKQICVYTYKGHSPSGSTTTWRMVAYMEADDGYEAGTVVIEEGATNIF